MLKDKIKPLKNSGQYPAQKVEKKAYTIKNNKLVNNHNTWPVKKREKGKNLQKEKMSL